jgi:hypothetical protein
MGLELSRPALLQDPWEFPRILKGLIALGGHESAMEMDSCEDRKNRCVSRPNDSMGTSTAQESGNQEMVM